MQLSKQHDVLSDHQRMFQNQENGHESMKPLWFLWERQPHKFSLWSLTTLPAISQFVRLSNSPVGKSKSSQNILNVVWLPQAAISSETRWTFSISLSTPAPRPGLRFWSVSRFYLSLLPHSLKCVRRVVLVKESLSSMNLCRPIVGLDSADIIVVATQITQISDLSLQ